MLMSDKNYTLEFQFSRNSVISKMLALSSCVQALESYC